MHLNFKCNTLFIITANYRINVSQNTSIWESVLKLFKFATMKLSIWSLVVLDNKFTGTFFHIQNMSDYSRINRGEITKKLAPRNSQFTEHYFQQNMHNMYEKLALLTPQPRFILISFRSFPTGQFTLDTLLFVPHNIFIEVPRKFLNIFLALRSCWCDQRLATRKVSDEPSGQLQTKIKACFSLPTQSGTHVWIKKRIANRHIDKLPKIYLYQRVEGSIIRATPLMCSWHKAYDHFPFSYLFTKVQ